MNTTPQNNQPFKTLQIIHLALCTGVTLFLGVTLMLNKGKGHTDIMSGDTPMLYVAIALALVMPVVSQLMYQKKLAVVDKSAPVNTKMAQYTSACLIRYALLEGAGLLNVVVWFVTHNLIAAITGGLIIVVMIAVRPVKSKVISILQISYPDTLE